MSASKGASKGKPANCHGYRVSFTGIGDDLSSKLATRFESWEDFKTFHDEIRGANLDRSSPNQITRIASGALTRW
jgi:hypothetical protein